MEPQNDPDTPCMDDSCTLGEKNGHIQGGNGLVSVTIPWSIWVKVWKIFFRLKQGDVFRFHVDFPGFTCLQHFS